MIACVPDDATLEVEAILENRDIGFVTEGQEAEIKLEAFPFTKYGVVTANVTQISADATLDEQRGAIYAVRIKPDFTSLETHEDIRLSLDMRATVEIKTGNRTVLEYLMPPSCVIVMKRLRKGRAHPGAGAGTLSNTTSCIPLVYRQHKCLIGVYRYTICFSVRF